MPYIKQSEREKLQDAYASLLVSLKLHSNFGSGAINYVLSSMLWHIFEENPSYARANELLGVLEAVKLEFYRRKVAKYEDEKMSLNGDL